MGWLQLAIGGRCDEVRKLRGRRGAWLASCRGHDSAGRDPVAAAGELVGVDLQLVIAIDVSASMDQSRRQMQREGYAGAICSAEVLAAIKSGPHGRIAIACFGWASPDYQRVIVPWTIVETPADADAVAHAIEQEPLASEAGTSISAALLFSERLLRPAGIRADRKIIDVSGDGPNNSGPLLRPARDSCLLAA